MSQKPAASMNRSLTISPSEIDAYSQKLLHLEKPMASPEILNRTIQGDIFSVLPFLPEQFVDLLILDPPYNLSRDFGTVKFK